MRPLVSVERVSTTTTATATATATAAATTTTTTTTTTTATTTTTDGCEVLAFRGGLDRANRALSTSPFT